MGTDRGLLGAGKWILAVMAPYVLLAVALNWWALPTMRIPAGPSHVVRILGLGGLIVGAAAIAVSFRRLSGARQRGDLCTTGPYRYVRHPLYATWIWLVLPGVTLLLGLPLLATASPVMYVVTRRALRGEEERLRATFGAEYEAYAARTNALVPSLPGSD
jgi:protein-S-isoprenylcysteine O-methyltransferase Ste14